MSNLRSVVFAGLCAALLAAGIGPVWAAQLQVGTLIGTAKGPDGSLLPGVEVTVTGAALAGSRTATTSGRGEYRVLFLPPGEYTIKMKLEGFVEVRKSVRVHAGQTAQADGELSSNGVAGDITVTPVAPSSTGATLTQRELDEIPTGRDPWTILQQTPGVLTDRINVGGNEAGQPSAYVLQGAPPSSSAWSVDGVNVTDMGDLGRSPTYYSFEDFEEVQTTSGGTDASRAYAGLRVSTITKSGGNNWRGSGRYFLGTGVNETAFEGAVPQRNTLFSSPNTYGGSLGGPVKKDRAFFFGSYGAESIDRDAFAADGKIAANFDGRRYEGKLTLSPSRGHRLIGSYIKIDNDRLGSGAVLGRASTSTTRQSIQDELVAVNYTGVLTDNFFIEGQYSDRQSTLLEDPRDGVPVFQNSTWNNSFLLYQTDRPQEQYKADASSFFNTGNLKHELKFGASRHHYEEKGSAGFADGGFTFLRGPGQSPLRYLTHGNNWDIDRSSTGLYASDTLTSGNLTLNVGVRFDRQTIKNGETQVDVNPLFPSLPRGSYTGADVFDDAVISPRFGLTYAIGQHRSTLLRASYSRFADQLGTSLGSFVNPLFGGPTYVYAFPFEDVNGNNLPDTSELKGRGSILGSGPGGIYTDPDRVDRNLRNPYLEEYLVGVSKRLGRRGLLRADLIGRRVYDTISDLPLLSDGVSTRVAQRSDYTLDQTLTGVDFENEPYQLPIYRLLPGFTQVGILKQNGDREAEYLGLTLHLNKRFSDRWSFAGHVNISDWKQVVPDSTAGDRNDLVGSDDNDGAPVAPQGGFGKSGLYMNSRWSFSANGLYEIAPGFSVSASVDGRQGLIVPASVSVLGGDRVNRQIQIGKFERRLPNVTVFNLQVSKMFSLKTARLAVVGEVLNLPNLDTVLYRDRNVTSATFGQVLEVLSPRVFRLGVRFSFR